MDAPSEGLALIRSRGLTTVIAVVGLGAGVFGCVPTAAGATAAGATTTPRGPGAGAGTAVLGPALPGDPGMLTGGISTGPGEYVLQGMPAGTVLLERAADGKLLAYMNVLGLTPGSRHDVLVEGSAGRQARLGTLTADSAGKARVMLSATYLLRPGSRIVILLGTGRGTGRGTGAGTAGGAGGDTAGGPLAGEPIALTGPLAAESGLHVLHPVTAGTDDAVAARPSGRARIAFDAARRILAVTVTAYGLTPGAHAAHIHLGSCLHQGAVKYALPDFVADGNGDVIGQTRVVTDVARVPGPGRWYLNLHQGNMHQILANGKPTLAFRPMLCADITSFATNGLP